MPKRIIVLMLYLSIQLCGSLFMLCMRLHIAAAQSIIIAAPAINHSPSVEELKQQLMDHEVRIRIQAARLLGSRVPELQLTDDVLTPVVDALSQTLVKDSEPLMREAAAIALAHIGVSSKSTIPNLLNVLKDSYANVRGAAAFALGRLGPGLKPQDTLVALSMALKQESDPLVREDIVFTVGLMALEYSTSAPEAHVMSNPQDRSRPDQQNVHKQWIDGIVSILQPALLDNTSTVRSTAISALGEIGANALSASNTLQNSLNDPDASVQEAAAVAIGKIGAGSPQAIDSLKSLLHSQNPALRAAAAEGLGLLGKGASASIVGLADALSDPEPFVRYTAATALAEIGDGAKPALLAALKSSSATVREAGAMGLGAMGTNAKDIFQSLAACLTDMDPTVRSAAVTALANIQEDPLRTEKALHPLLNDSDDGVREAVAHSLRSAGIAALPALKEALQDKAEAVRLSAVLSLTALGRKAAEAAPNLLPLLKDPDVSLRLAVAQALEELSNHTQPIRHALIYDLDDPDASVRTTIALALKSFGPDAVNDVIYALKVEKLDSSAVAALQVIGDDAVSALIIQLKNPELALQASYALGKIKFKDAKQTEDAIKALTNALDNPKSTIRSKAAESLGRVRTASVSALQRLEELLSPSLEPVDVRRAAATAIGQIAPKDNGALTALTMALKDPDAGVRSLTAMALGNSISLSEKQLLALVGELKDSDTVVRIATATALGSLKSQVAGAGTPNPIALSGLETLAQGDASPEARAAAIAAIEQSGAQTTDAVNVLKHALSDTVPAVRAAAASALRSTQDKDAIAQLTRLLNSDTDAGVRAAAATSLGFIRVKETTSIQTLADAFADDDISVQDAAAKAVLRIGPSTLGSLTKTFKADTATEGVRHNVMKTFGEFGPEASSVVPVIRYQLKDSNPDVQIDAMMALRQIGHSARSSISELGPLRGSANTKVAAVADATFSSVNNTPRQNAASGTPNFKKIVLPKFSAVVTLDANQRAFLGKPTSSLNVVLGNVQGALAALLYNQCDTYVFSDGFALATPFERLDHNGQRFDCSLSKLPWWDLGGDLKRLILGESRHCRCYVFAITKSNITDENRDLSFDNDNIWENVYALPGSSSDDLTNTAAKIWPNYGSCEFKVIIYDYMTTGAQLQLSEMQAEQGFLILKDAGIIDILKRPSRRK